ncbi:hypothetical protein [Acetobacter tropicalis]|uniref:hypothetical protein n=1 Tax=Acetobacter tropicalis TaxID=104102 RepID=UPI00159440D3|nr:hypothetical protein [Acetobacter tropicalis]
MQIILFWCPGVKSPDFRGPRKGWQPFPKKIPYNAQSEMKTRGALYENSSAVHAPCHGGWKTGDGSKPFFYQSDRKNASFLEGFNGRPLFAASFDARTKDSLSCPEGVYSGLERTP